MEDHLINDSNKDEILLRFLTGSASSEERKLVMQWVNISPDHRIYFEKLKLWHNNQSQETTSFESGKEKSWERVKSVHYQELLNHQTENWQISRSKMIRIFVVSSAAAILFAFMMGFWVKSYLVPQKPTQAYNEIIVPLGARSRLTLSDGTIVWLNAGSKFKYPSDFSQGTRNVYLEGEAFFDVTKREKQLFVVNTSDVKIKVYGTQFNVKSYPDENKIQTTLVRGLVTIEPVRSGDKQPPVYLKPLQTATYFKTPPVKEKDISGTNSVSSRPDGLSSVREVKLESEEDPLPITSWKDARWVIVAENLGSLAVKLERRFNVKISFATDSLKNYKFSGTLRDETFEQVLKIIRFSAPVVYSMENNQVIFREDKLYKRKYDTMILHGN